MGLPPADLTNRHQPSPGTVPELGRLPAACLLRPSPPGRTAHWLDWGRRHQARSHCYHQRTRLATETR